MLLKPVSPRDGGNTEMDGTAGLPEKSYSVDK
jgi:hypothetical protein